MNINNKPPVLVPPQFCAELERLSKAALMDIAWDFAVQSTQAECPESEPEKVMFSLRFEIEAVLAARRDPNSPAGRVLRKRTDDRRVVR